MIGVAGPLAFEAPKIFWQILVAIGAILVALPSAFITYEYRDLVRRKRMIPVIGMMVSGILFVAFAGWYFWPSHGVEATPISDNEKFRRIMVTTKIREEYIKNNPQASPTILAGIENPPADWFNRKLLEMGETWRMQNTVKKSTDPGLFVDCHLVHFPLRAPADGPMYVLNLFPVPLENRGGGLAEYSHQAGAELNLGPEIRQAYQCKITNYGPKPMIGVIIGLYMIFQENLPDEKNPNASHSGNVIAERPWRIDIKKIDPGINTPFEFYIWNVTPHFAMVSFPENATGEYIGDSERLDFRISSSNSSPLHLAPSHDPKNNAVAKSPLAPPPPTSSLPNNLEKK